MLSEKSVKTNSYEKQINVSIFLNTVSTCTSTKTTKALIQYNGTVNQLTEFFTNELHLNRTPSIIHSEDISTFVRANNPCNSINEKQYMLISVIHISLRYKTKRVN